VELGYDRKLHKICSRGRLFSFEKELLRLDTEYFGANTTEEAEKKKHLDASWNYQVTLTSIPRRKFVVDLQWSLQDFRKSLEDDANSGVPGRSARTARKGIKIVPNTNYQVTSHMNTSM